MSFTTVVVRAFYKGLALGAKHAPKIMVGTGVALMGASVVVACKESTKAEELHEEFERRMSIVEKEKDRAAKKEIIYTAKNEREDITLICAQTAAKYIRNYWKTIALFGAGALLVFGGHHILTRRNLALAAAYKGLNESFKAYRGRIVDEFGKDVDYNALHGFKMQDIVTTDDSGNDVTESVKVLDPEASSIYSILWDDMYSTEWTPNPNTNMLLLEGKERCWTDVLHTRGYVHLDEVYRDLGVWGRIGEDKQKAATAVGWVLGCGDDYVSFGLRKDAVINPAKAEFINGLEPSILLDFNVDGIIHDLL